MRPRYVLMFFAIAGTVKAVNPELQEAALVGRGLLTHAGLGCESATGEQIGRKQCPVVRLCERGSPLLLGALQGQQGGQDERREQGRGASTA
jgi:hypothetical protein